MAIKRTSIFERLIREATRNPSQIFLLWALVLATVFGFALSFGQQSLRDVLDSPSSRTFLAVATGTVFISALFAYLQPRKKMIERESIVLRDRTEHLLQTLKKEREVSAASKAGLSEAEKKALIADLQQKIGSETASQLLEPIALKVTEQLKIKGLTEAVDGMYKDITDRLADEVSSLNQRGSLNLIIGIATTITGLFILGYVVFRAEHATTDPALIASYYLPRLSLVTFVEVFAFFFLKLYKNSLSEIKYFQNELTNVESKFSALRVGLRLNDAEMQRNVVQALCATERNHLLKKGETTAELELAKINKTAFAEITKNLSEMVHRLKKD